jgi:uncharacterized protein (TIGR02466 family)
MINHIFSTPVKIISLNNINEINIKLAKAMTLGFEYNFTDNLNEEDSIYLEKLFKDEAELFLNELYPHKIDLILSKSWINSTKKYEFQTPHEHSGNTVIAVYYINTNENSGDLLLHDPRGAIDFIPSIEKDSKGNKLSGRSFVRVKPKTGDLILFPSYLVHSVEPNMTDDIRISLAMNFKYKDFTQFKKIGTKIKPD